MEKMMVSVIVAVYNVELYLETCIKSICGQSYKNLEILLIDDGSKDGSGNICDRWAKADDRIVVVHQENGGVSRARNVGIKRAGGEFLVFVDSDDFLEPEYIQCLVEQQRANCMTIAGYYIEIDMLERKKKTSVVLGRDEIEHLKQDDIVELYKRALFNAIWNKLYVTRILKEEEILFEEGMSLGEDALFNLRYLRTGEFEFIIINKPLYHYMKRGNESLDNKYRPDFYESQKTIFEAFIRFLREIQAGQEQIGEIYGFYFNALVVALDNLYCNRKQLGRQKYDSLFREIRNKETFDEVIIHLRGKWYFIYKLRLWGIRHGFYWLDYHMREVVKRLLGMK